MSADTKTAGTDTQSGTLHVPNNTGQPSVSRIRCTNATSAKMKVETIR